MPQITALIDTLKAQLKARGLTYRTVAKSLALSEASIKRCFAQRQFSLQRLEQICQLLDMELSDLMKLMQSRQQQLNELSEEQEQELVADIRLLLVAFVVVNGWQFTDIISWYRLTENETIQYLARLDRLRLIELLPNNRIRLRISPNFAWRRNGPIQRYFSEHLLPRFLESDFASSQESLQFPSGMLSEASCQQLERRILQLVQDFHDLNEQDRHRPLSEKIGYSLLLAFRPWQPREFEQLRRQTHA